MAGEETDMKTENNLCKSVILVLMRVVPPAVSSLHILMASLTGLDLVVWW